MRSSTSPATRSDNGRSGLIPPSRKIELRGDVVQPGRDVVRSRCGGDRLHRHPRCEELLDHRVVEVAGDPLALVHQRHTGAIVLPFGDVADGGDGPLFTVEGHRAQADLDREQTAVGVFGQQVQSAAHRPGQGLLGVAHAVVHVPIPLLGRDQAVDRHAGERLDGVAEERCRGRVRQRDHARHVDQQQSVG
jgi:hypothetical protein